jgi:hypothetical protein
MDPVAKREKGKDIVGLGMVVWQNVLSTARDTIDMYLDWFAWINRRSWLFGTHIWFTKEFARK